MSKHQFDTDIAKEHGIEAAIILDNIAFWIEKNKANEKHFHDGAYWTYNSIKAFNELFPYMSESTIRRVLKSLEEKGLIGTGNYNKAGYDRTLWYSITTKGFNILNKSICHFEQMEVSESANGFSQSSEPIPDIKPVKKPVKKLYSKLPMEVYSEITNHYSETYESIKNAKPFIDYPSVNKRIKDIILGGATKENILKAIDNAKKDSWITDNCGFSIMTILSGSIFMKLVNAPIQNSFPKKNNSAPGGLRVFARDTQLDMEEVK